MKKEITIRVQPSVAFVDSNLRKYIAEQVGCDQSCIYEYDIIKRSIDARHKNVFVNLKINVWINEHKPKQLNNYFFYGDVSKSNKVIVVGAGPAGLFAALRLIELGLCPIIIERGKNIRERKKDIAKIRQTQTINSESNYSFGEGGAGAYSDGKLYTRSKKRGNVNDVLRIFCQFGASENILIDAHPHIGTDKLPRIIENMRKQILKSGGNVLFQTCVTDLIIRSKKVIGVKTNTEQEFFGPVILATGHSARDVYKFLFNLNIAIEPKNIAIGVRLEHPAHIIDQLQYHQKCGRGLFLPAAEYSFVTQVEKRGVYSFCMCPGGFVVPAGTGPEQIVVNGMSPSNRNGKWSNSGIVVETRVEDLEGELRSCIPNSYLIENCNKKELMCLENGTNPLKILYLQEVLERKCWLEGNKKQTAPAQNMVDFVNETISNKLPESSYAPGLTTSSLHSWLPSFYQMRLKNAFLEFNKKSKGFLTDQATMIAIETRTSSPVRILRNHEKCTHIDYEGLYPCGEGAGYAGGIVSAAIDGIRCANAVAELEI